MKTDAKFAPILKTLWDFLYAGGNIKNKKYENGIWVNRLYDGIYVKGKPLFIPLREYYARHTFIKRLRYLERAGAIEIKKVKNRKHITLSPYYFSVFEQLENIRKYYQTIVEIFKKIKDEKELLEKIREDLHFSGLMLMEIIFLNLIKLKKPFQKKLFWFVFMPELISVLDEYFYELILLTKNKKILNGLEKETITELKNLVKDYYQRKNAPYGSFRAKALLNPCPELERLVSLTGLDEGGLLR